MSDDSVPNSIGMLLSRARRRQFFALLWADLCRWGLALTGLIIIAGVVSVRRGDSHAWWFAAASCLAPLLATAHAYRRLSEPRVLLRTIDASLDQHDLLGAAYEFWSERARGGAEDSRDELAEAAKASVVRQAHRRASRVSLEEVFPMRRYRVGWTELSLVGLLLLVILLPEFPGPEPGSAAEIHTEGPRSAPSPSPRTSRLLAPLHRELQSLRASQDDLGAIARKVEQLLREIAGDNTQLPLALQELDRLNAALERLHQERTAEGALDPELLAAGLREIAEKLRNLEEGKSLARALAELDAPGVEDSLGRALNSDDKATTSKSADSEDERRLLRGLSQGLERALKRRTDTEDSMEQLERRLQRDSARQDARDREDRVAMEEQREELQRLQRRQRAEARARDRLESLREDVQTLRRTSPRTSGSPSNSTPRGQDPGATHEGERASYERATRSLIKDLKDATDRVSKSQRAARTQGLVREAQRTLRRLATEGTRSSSRDAHAQAFERAAGGSPSAFVEGNAPASGDDPAERGGTRAAASVSPRRARATGAADDGQEGSSAGNGAALEGAMGADLPAQDELREGPPRSPAPLSGTSGPGRSRAVTIQEATQRGFATSSYDEVFTDYRGLAQSALDDETIPASQREAARRYFRLIQPRK